MPSPLCASSLVLQPALNFLGKGSINDGLFRGLPGAIQGKPKGGGEKATSLRFPAWFFQGEKLAMHNGSGVLIEAEHNLHAGNAAVNAVMSEPGPLSSGRFEKFGSRTGALGAEQRAGRKHKIVEQLFEGLMASGHQVGHQGQKSAQTIRSIRIHVAPPRQA